jgi:predicted porin
MKKTAMTKAALLALATFGASAAFAQSSLTIYGNIDVGVDNVHKGQGDVSGSTLALLAASNPAYAAGFVNKSTVTRLTSSISSVNSLGFRGVEDLGGGYKGGFVLEGQFQVDTGAQSGQDGRMWGRQAFVSLTTPGGEIRLGRQYAPMFFTFAFTTVEALGGADIQGSGLIVNNLQVRQDNQVSYWLKTGGLTAALSYATNAGVDALVSSSRGQAAGATGGQIIGGQTAGNETANSGNRGQAFGLFVNYAFDPGFLVNGSYHSNKFGNAQLISGPIVWADLDKYEAYALGAKYTVPGAGTVLSGIFHHGKFTNDSGNNEGPKLNTWALGVKHPIGNFAVGAQFAHSEFTNFTDGKDTSLMLIGDYNFSKRTKLYIRAGYAKDEAGNTAATGRATPGGGVRGGPLPLLTGFGSLETPFFSGGGANVDATTRVVAIGIRHQF